MRQSLYSNNTQHSRRCRKEVHTKRIRESGALIRANFGKTLSTATVPGPQNCKYPALAESHSAAHVHCIGQVLATQKSEF